MFWRIAFFVSVFVLVGCSWMPDRDNPEDPHSPYYEPPPQANRPPHVDTLYVVTLCRDMYNEHTCPFVIICRASDPDRNILYDSVLAEIFTVRGRHHVFGYMSYDAFRSAFVLGRPQQGEWGTLLDSLINGRVRVTVIDDSGATDFREEMYPAPNLSFPVIRSPKESDDGTPQNVGPQPLLVWRPYVGARSFHVSVLWRAADTTWQRTLHNPSMTDTSVAVSDSLPFTSDTSIEYYAWFLTVVDMEENQMTSRPALFFVRE